MFDAALSETPFHDDEPAAPRPGRVRLLDMQRRPSVARAPQPAGPACAPRPARDLDRPEHLAAIEATLAELRPRLKADGGDCELVAGRGRRGPRADDRRLRRLPARLDDGARRAHEADREARVPGQGRPGLRGGAMRPVYLDNNATTRVDPEVVAAMLPYLTEHFGNPSSPHAFGAPGRQGDEDGPRPGRRARRRRLPDEILFTSGGTESDNTAIRAALAANPDRNEVVVSAVEHPAVLALIKAARGGRPDQGSRHPRPDAAAVSTANAFGPPCRRASRSSR